MSTFTALLGLLRQSVVLSLPPRPPTPPHPQSLCPEGTISNLFKEFFYLSINNVFVLLLPAVSVQALSVGFPPREMRTRTLALSSPRPLYTHQRLPAPLPNAVSVTSGRSILSALVLMTT